MNKRNPYINLILLIAVIILPTTLNAADLKMTTYYPSVNGAYDRFNLAPRTVNLSGSCTVGTLYVNSTKTLQYCRNVSGTGTWGPPTSLWTQTGDNIVLSDGVTNPALHVGIGTTVPEFKLTLINDAGIIATGTFGSGMIIPNGLGAGSRLIWYPRKAAFRAGFVDAAQWNNANIGDYSAALGKNSTASGIYSVVGGGDNNIASGQYSNVIGGQNNTASGDYSAITGGLNNTASGQHAVITGGQSNSATANYATILGGQSNQATAIYTTVGGGLANLASVPYSSINGGRDNKNIDIFPFVFNGSVGYPTIGGGKNNRASNDYTVVSGGENNTAGGIYSSVGGGKNNTYYIILPGDPIPSYTRISGGEDNRVGFGNYTTVSGGKNNKAIGTYATVGGGLSNQAASFSTAVGGGERNSAGGQYSMIMGGTDNTAGGDYSWAEGKNMKLSSTAARTFAWGYSDTAVNIVTPDAFIIAPGTIAGNPWNPKFGIRDINPVGVLEINANASTDDYINIKKTVSGDTFIVKNNGYIGIGRATPSDISYVLQVGTNGTNGNGAYCGATGIWWQPSSRKLKNHISPLSSSEAENTLDQLQPVTFHYKATAQQTNVGFIAEDVPELVAMQDRKSLNTMDIVAVLTKAAQDQQKHIDSQQERIKNLKREIQILQSELGP